MKEVLVFPISRPETFGCYAEFSRSGGVWLTVGHDDRGGYAFSVTDDCVSVSPPDVQVVREHIPEEERSDLDRLEEACAAAREFLEVVVPSLPSEAGRDCAPILTEYCASVGVQIGRVVAGERSFVVVEADEEALEQWRQPLGRHLARLGCPSLRSTERQPALS